MYSTYVCVCVRTLEGLKMSFVMLKKNEKQSYPIRYRKGIR